MTDIETSSNPPRYNESATRVFAIPELLETILFLLPTKDILISQRVAKNWKSTIDGSFLLKQALFIEPIPAETAWVAHIHTEKNPHAVSGWENLPNAFPIANCMVQQLPANEVDTSKLDPEAGWHVSTKVILNTLLHNRGHWKQYDITDRLERGEGLRLGRTKTKIQGYGKEMFLTQPPCKEILLWVNWGRPTHVFNEDGIRFHEILEKVESAPVLPYLPHMFMQAKGCIALTEDEEELVEEIRRECHGDGVEKEGEQEVVQAGFNLMRPLQSLMESIGIISNSSRLHD